MLCDVQFGPLARVTPPPPLWGSVLGGTDSTSDEISCDQPQEAILSHIAATHGWCPYILPPMIIGALCDAGLPLPQKLEDSFASRLANSGNAREGGA